MKSRLSQFLLGGLILVIGLYFLSMLGNQLKLESELGKYWPLLLIFLGLFTLGTSKEHLGFPQGLIGLGSVLTLGRLGIFKQVSLLEPVLIMLVGILIIALATGNPNKNKPKSATNSHDRVVK
jgi:membrane protease YdiL (CAAX protease family)